MEYTTLGRTGLVVSRLALGCMSYGDPKWRSWVLTDEDAQPFFRRAIEAGITFFDTSDMYSLGVSEEVTGRALRRYGTLDELVIATKVHFPMNDRPNMKGLDRKHIVQGCEASLTRLGVDCIDLYQIHRLDRSVPMDETLEVLDHLVTAPIICATRLAQLESVRLSPISARATQLATKGSCAMRTSCGRPLPGRPSPGRSCYPIDFAHTSASRRGQHH